MKWRAKRTLNFSADRPWQQGYAHFGFLGHGGAQYLLQHDEHWLGRLTAEGEWLPDGSLLVSSSSTKEIWRARPGQLRLNLQDVQHGLLRRLPVHPRHER